MKTLKQQYDETWAEAVRQNRPFTPETIAVEAVREWLTQKRQEYQYKVSLTTGTKINVIDELLGELQQ